MKSDRPALVCRLRREVRVTAPTSLIDALVKRAGLLHGDEPITTKTLGDALSGVTFEDAIEGLADAADVGWDWTDEFGLQALAEWLEARRRPLSAIEETALALGVDLPEPEPHPVLFGEES